jgi:hypothetical protein
MRTLRYVKRDQLFLLIVIIILVLALRFCPGQHML